MTDYNTTFRKTADRTCSALLCNCLQLSCCLPQNSFVAVTVPPQSANWMSELASQDSSIKIRDLVMPGTHDSASYTISGWKPFSAVGLTQSLSVTDQLMSGARYLDIRFAGSANDPNALSIWHGCLEGGSLKDILEEIRNFLKQHPGEFLVLEVVPEYGRSLTPDQKDIFLDLVKDVFGDLIFPGKDMCDLQRSLTLQDVIVDQKKQVAILVHSRFFENYTNKSEQDLINEYGYVKSQRWMKNRWHNTRECTQLLEWNLEECEKCNRGDSHNSMWLNNQFVLTPGVGGGFNDILGALTGQNSLQPVANASGLYEPCVLDNYLRQHADKHWNLLMLDGIDRCPIIVQFAIALNFPTKVQIKRAAAACGTAESAVDVTERVKSLVCRDRVLLLTNVSTDLDLPTNEGVLTIAYQMVGEEEEDVNAAAVDEVLTVDYDSDTQLILSKFVITEFTGDKVTVTTQDQTEGFVSRGQVSSEPPSQKSAPVLKFNKVDTGAVEFQVAE